MSHTPAAATGTLKRAEFWTALSSKKGKALWTLGQGKHTTGVRLTREQVIHIRSHASPVSDLFGA